MWTYAYVCITFLSVFCAAIISFVSFPHISSLLSFSYRRLTHTHTAARRATDTHTYSKTRTHQLKYTCIHTFYRILAHTHTHTEHTHAHWESATRCRCLFSFLLSLYTLLPYILFVFAVVCKRKNKKKNRRIAVFFSTEILWEICLRHF